MWSRRSATSTRRPRSRAQRSATVRPNSPEPATTRSAFTAILGGDGRRVARPPRGDEPPVERAADPGRRQPVTAADAHVADVLRSCGEPAPEELALQAQLGAQQRHAPATLVRAVAHAVVL